VSGRGVRGEEKREPLTDPKSKRNDLPEAGRKNKKNPVVKKEKGNTGRESGKTSCTGRVQKEGK